MALITINPGGGCFEPPSWSVEAGSAYAIESWKSCAPGHEKLQRQVIRMFQIMGVKPEEVLSGYLVPFRSQEWGKLPRKSESISFGIGLWQEVLKQAKVETVIAFGKDTAPHMIKILEARLRATHPAG